MLICASRSPQRGRCVRFGFDVTLTGALASETSMRIAALLFFACGIFAQDKPLFKTDVSLVHVDAEVTGPDGRTLTGFSKEDFRVLDDGQEQPILHFSAGDESL